VVANFEQIADELVDLFIDKAILIL